MICRNQGTKTWRDQIKIWFFCQLIGEDVDGVEEANVNDSSVYNSLSLLKSPIANMEIELSKLKLKVIAIEEGGKCKHKNIIIKDSNV